MATTDAKVVPLYGKPYRLPFDIRSVTGTLIKGAAGLDSERSINQGTFANCTNEAKEIPSGSGVYYLDLTAAEMTSICTAILVKTTTASATPTVRFLYPQPALSGATIDDLKAEIAALRAQMDSLFTTATLPELVEAIVAGLAAQEPS
jgi:hypothetical protein